MISSRFDRAFAEVAAAKATGGIGGRFRSTGARRRRAALLAIALFASVALHPGQAFAAENDAVRVWNERATLTLANGPTGDPPGLQFAPPVAFIHLAIVQGAVYDAVNAIKGGHQPYIKGLKAATSASKGAAAATAAHDVLIALVDQAPETMTLTATVKNGIKARLNDQYEDSLDEISDGQAKNKGIEVGKAAAAAMLASRVNDGRFGAAGFPVPANPGPGEWRPSPGNDPNAWVRNVKPFTLPTQDWHVTSGPPVPLTGALYATEFNEVKAKGRATMSSRSEADTLLAYWTAPNPVLLLFPALRQVAQAKGLTISEQARFHAMTSMAGADSLINCWAEKARWGFWRPTTAIQQADLDNNPATSPDPAWTSLLTVPPYSDEPSGANCVYSGVMNSAKAFFGSNLATFSIASPGIGPGTGSTRNYTRFTDVVTDVIEARIYGGLHFRRADENGAILGRKVAEYIDANFFNCGPPGQCRQEGRD